MKKAYLFSRVRSSGLIDGQRGSVHAVWLCGPEKLPAMDRRIKYFLFFLKIF